MIEKSYDKVRDVMIPEVKTIDGLATVAEAIRSAGDEVVEIGRVVRGEGVRYTGSLA